MSMIVDLLFSACTEDDDEISDKTTAYLNSIYPKIPLKDLKKRQRDWPKIKENFGQKMVQVYGKILWLISGNTLFGKNDHTSWPLNKEGERGLIEELFLKWIQFPGKTEKELIQLLIQDAKDGKPLSDIVKDSLLKHAPKLGIIESPRVNNPEFPFLDTPPPTNMFSNCLTKDYKLSCLKIMCPGYKANFLNRLNSHDAWLFADERYFRPFLKERLQAFEREIEEPLIEEEIGKPYITQETIDELTSKIENLDINAIQADVKKIRNDLQELKVQLLSVGMTKPVTELERPLYSPPEIEQRAITKPEVKIILPWEN